MRIVTLTGLLCLAACKSRESSTCGDAEGFVRGLYAQYAEGATPRAFETIFDEETLGLIKNDREAVPGEVGFLDYDPVCNCQDWEKLAVTDVRVTRDPQTVAAVAFRNGGKMFRQNFELRCEAGGWRVHDIVTLPEGGSLREGIGKR